MGEVTLKGKAVRISGNLPETSTVVPDFKLVATDLSDISLDDFKKNRVIMNIFPSMETLVCAESVRRFNEMANGLDNTKVLCISKDLPFAHERFNTAEGIDNVVSLSEMRNNDFGDQYGIRIVDGPLAGLLSRGVVVLDEKKRVIYTQLVAEIGEEPDYESALQAAANLADVNEPVNSGRDTPQDNTSGEFCAKMPTGEHARLSDDDDSCDDGRSGKI